MTGDAPPRPPRILIVDDEPDIAEMLVDILETEGYRIETAANGAEALARIADAPVDLIISDLIMPVLDGPGLYQTLCRTHDQLSLRIIFVTGDTLSASAQDFLAAAARPVIEKPFMPDDVRRTVRASLSPGPAD